MSVKMLLIVLFPSLLMVVADVRGWLCWFAGKRTVQGTRHIASVPLNVMMVALFISLISIVVLSFSPYVYTSSVWFSTYIAIDYTEPGILLCMSFTLSMFLSIGRRRVVITYPLSRLLYCREHSDAFALHFSPRITTHLTRPFRRIVEGAGRDLLRVVHERVTAKGLAELQSGGARSFTIATMWMVQDGEKSRRLLAVHKRLSAICPGGRVEFIEVRMGVVETIWLRIFQWRMRTFGFDPGKSGYKTMADFWATFAEKDIKNRERSLLQDQDRRYFLRPVTMPGVRLMFPK